MPTNITLPDPPSSWDALTKEQLIFIHSLPRSEMAEPVYKLQVFLHLAVLELCQESFYQEPASTDNAASIASIQSQLDWMESVLDGKAPITVVLRPTKDFKTPSEATPSGRQPFPSEEREEGLLFSISDQDLFDAVMHFTKFLDDPYTLMAQPLGEIVIGTHTYKTPDPLFANLTYEQYQNAQYALQRLWNASQYIENEQKNVVEAEKKHKDSQAALAKFAGDAFKPTPFAPPQDCIDRINKGLNQINESQAEFLVHTLTCLQPKVYDEAVTDKDGKPLYARGKAKIRQILHLEEPNVDVDKFSRDNKEEITKHAPKWLFPILYQHFQSSLTEHKKLFPKLFSGSGGGGNDNQFVATISTLNTLMKEQGYADQRATLDANVVFNFQKLDELTRRAEEMKRMNDEIRRKSHKR